MQLEQNDALYPQALLRYLGPDAPPVLSALGDTALLKREKLALFCSVKCPGQVILQLYDAARRWRDNGVTVISGFHSPMEKECLEILLRGTQPIIICPARSLDTLRLPRAWQAPLEQKRLLLLSPFAAPNHRITKKLAHQRNLFIAALAEQVLLAHVTPGGQTQALANQIGQWHKPVVNLLKPDAPIV